MLLEKCFVIFYVLSFPPAVYVGTLNLIASIPDPSILNFHIKDVFSDFHVTADNTKVLQKKNQYRTIGAKKQHC